MENKKAEHHRHGDVITIDIDCDFEPGEVLEHKTLAYGEVTGHSHRITAGVATVFKFDPKKHDAVRKQVIEKLHERNKLDDPMVKAAINNATITHLVKVESEQAMLTHEEHKQQALSKGNHAVLGQVSFRGKSWQKVVD